MVHDQEAKSRRRRRQTRKGGEEEEEEKGAAGGEVITALIPDKEKRSRWKLAEEVENIFSY